MAVTVNPLYARALERQENPDAGNKFDDVPNFKFNDINDSIRGVIDRINGPKKVENTYQGVTKTIDQLILTLRDATVKRADGTTEEYSKISVWLQKNGHFAALGKALYEAEKSEPQENMQFGMKWTGLGPKVGEGSRPHKFDAKLAE